MMKKVALFLLLSVLIAGCSSRNAYEQASMEYDAVQNELKATVNAQNAADDCMKAREVFKEKMGKLMNIREENEKNDMPLGPSVSSDLEPEDAVNTLKQNFDVLSDKASELKKKKASILAAETGKKSAEE